MPNRKEDSKELPLTIKILIGIFPFSSLLTLLFQKDIVIKLIKRFLESLMDNTALFYSLILTLCFFGAQFLSGYAFLRDLIPPSNRRERMSKYFYDRLFILTYSLYELFGYLFLYLTALSLSLMFHSIYNLNTTPGKLVISIIAWSFVISYAMGVFYSYLIKKFGSKFTINDKTEAGKFITKFQYQICNLILISSVAITIYGVIEIETISSDQTLFIGLSSLVVGCTCFQAIKSNLTRFFHFSSFK